MTPQTGRVRWRKSSYSGGTNGNCVELANAGAVRDSKNPGGPILEISVAGLVAAAKGDRLAR